MSTIYLPVGSVLYLNSNIKLSEHNRQPVSIGKTRIEQTKRMNNGLMRKFFIAEKETISVSWNMLPSFSTMTVDGGYGAVDLKTFYEGVASKAAGALSGRSTFDVSISYGNTVKNMEMMFTSCSFEIVKRNVKEQTTDSPQEFWNVSISMEEI
jgi:hypothetical protein